MKSYWIHFATGMLALSVSASLSLAQELSSEIFDPNVQQTGYFAQLSDSGNTWPPNTGAGGVSLAGCGGCTDGSCGGGEVISGGFANVGCDAGIGCDAGGCSAGGISIGGCGAAGIGGGCGDLGGGICSGSCDDGCSSCCGPWSHYTSVFGGLLYLRPRNADVAYGVPINGPIVGPPANNPIEIGRVGVVDPDFDVSFFGGFNYAMSARTSIYLRYATYDARTSDSISIDPPNVIRSLVSHPSALAADNDSLFAEAHQDINFDIIDLQIRRLWKCCGLTGINTVFGPRYASLEQRFLANYVDNEVENVETDIDFEGVGARIGLELDRYSCSNRLHTYVRGYTSFVAGEFDTRYHQGRDVDNLVVRADWDAGRIVPILDLEVGLGWTTASRRMRFNVGYVYSAWYNTVMTEDYITAVQEGNFTNLGDTLTFDGLQAQLDWRF